MGFVRFKSGLAWAVTFSLGCGCLGGCPGQDGARKYKTDPVRLDLGGVKPAVDYGDLAAVLKEAVRGGGRVEPVALKRVAARLDAQVKRLAVTGPQATPQLFAAEEDRLAYWYNARAAWALALALRNDCPAKLPTAALEVCPFPLDGRQMTLDGIDAILVKDDDWRVVVAAPGIRQDRARLPAQPLSAKDVRQRIARRLSELVDDQSRFEIDQEQKVLRVPPVLWAVRHRVIAARRRKYGATGPTFITALLEYVTDSAHRRLQDVIGLRCVPAASTDRVVFPPSGKRAH